MQQIFSNTTKVLVDQKAGNSMLYLPLDKLLQQQAGEASSSVRPPANEPPRGTSESGHVPDSSQMRDLLRNREGRP
jgi:membrane protease subunit HflK